jgi:hypothetical protein
LTGALFEVLGLCALLYGWLLVPVLAAGAVYMLVYKPGSS